MMQPGEELVDITDEQGRIVAQASRREMRARGLPHRATFVVQIMAELLPGTSDFVRRLASSVYDEKVEAWFASVDWATGLTVYDGPGHDLSGVVSVRPDSPVVVHQRADWKDLNPSYWDLAFGGVCDAGEMWRPSAARELAEEAGLTDVPLLPLGAGRYQDERGMVFGGLFLAPTCQPPIPNDGEVVAVEYVAIEELADWCGRHQVCQDSLTFVPPLLDYLVQSTG